MRNLTDRTNADHYSKTATAREPFSEFPHVFITVRYSSALNRVRVWFTHVWKPDGDSAQRFQPAYAADHFDIVTFSIAQHNTHRETYRSIILTR